MDKIASVKDKIHSVLWLYGMESIINVQRIFGRCCGFNLPDAKTTKRWYDRFKKQETLFIGPEKADLLWVKLLYEYGNRFNSGPTQSTIEFQIFASKVTIRTVTEGMLKNTWREIEYRLGILWATEDAHIEIYWGMRTYKKITRVKTKYWNKYISNNNKLIKINIYRQGMIFDYTI